MGRSGSPIWDVKPAIRLDRRDPYLLLQHVTVFVQDQDRSLRFYVDCLGFSVVLDHDSRMGDALSRLPLRTGQQDWRWSLRSLIPRSIPASEKAGRSFFSPKMSKASTANGATVVSRFCIRRKNRLGEECTHNSGTLMGTPSHSWGLIRRIEKSKNSAA